MKKHLLCTLLSVMAFVCGANAQVVINEVYGGGGNSGATLKNDFIELYNKGNAAVDLTGWSVQYASSTGTSWQVTNLSGSIPANGYYLIQQAAGTGGTQDLPTPNATGTIAMAGGAGKVALVNVTTALTGSCPTGAQIIDFVGYGSGTNCFEGSGSTPAPSATLSVQRKQTGGVPDDTNNNNADFATGTPSPQNAGTVTPSNTLTLAAGANGAEPSTPGTFTLCPLLY